LNSLIKSFIVQNQKEKYFKKILENFHIDEIFLYNFLYTKRFSKKNRSKGVNVKDVNKNPNNQKDKRK
jgi:hypothetical protein